MLIFRIKMLIRVWIGRKSKYYSDSKLRGCLDVNVIFSYFYLNNMFKTFGSKKFWKFKFMVKTIVDAFKV